MYRGKDTEGGEVNERGCKSDKYIFPTRNYYHKRRTHTSAHIRAHTQSDRIENFMVIEQTFGILRDTHTLSHKVEFIVQSKV